MISPYLQPNWKLPKVEKGQEVRFLYFNSEMNDYRGFRGTIVGIRYLNHNPIDRHTKLDNQIKRGSILYTIQSPGRKVMSFYNQRMANMEVIK